MIPGLEMGKCEMSLEYRAVVESKSTQRISGDIQKDETSLKGLLLIWRQTKINNDNNRFN